MRHTIIWGEKGKDRLALFKSLIYMRVKRGTIKDLMKSIKVGQKCLNSKKSRAMPNDVFIFFAATGTCLPIWGKKQGEVCYKDNDCESGFLCVEESGQRSCQAPVPGEKGLGNP